MSKYFGHPQKCLMMTQKFWGWIKMTIGRKKGIRKKYSNICAGLRIFEHIQKPYQVLLILKEADGKCLWFKVLFTLIISSLLDFSIPFCKCDGLAITLCKEITKKTIKALIVPIKYLCLLKRYCVSLYETMVNALFE